MFLVLSALQEAAASGLEYVVISTGVNAPVSTQFTGRRGPTVKPLELLDARDRPTGDTANVRLTECRAPVLLVPQPMSARKAW